MQKLLLLFLMSGMSSFVHAQEAEEILKKYYDNLSKIEHLSYRIHNIDTFLTGQVWDKKGYAILKRNEDEPSSGFIFYGKQEAHPEATVFDGKEIFRINHQTEAFQKQAGIIYQAIGSPGGQMILPELLFKQLPTDQLELEVKEEVFILKLHIQKPNLPP